LRVVHYRKRRRLRRELVLARDRLDRQSPEPRGLANMAAAE
jgi:hypothetical protein